MAGNVVEKVDERVPVRNVLISVSDKQGLDFLGRELTEILPDVKILSTGGTFAKIKEILGEKAEGSLMQVSEYTGQPETQGGLVKTLDFKIYLGLLTETYNPSHQEDLKRIDAEAIDLVVVNLYPFQKTVEKHLPRFWYRDCLWVHRRQVRADHWPKRERWRHAAAVRRRLVQAAFLLGLLG